MKKEEVISEEMLDKISEFYYDASEYIYDWACVRTGRYLPVDHTAWEARIKEIMKDYNFNIGKIKEAIENGAIELRLYKESNPLMFRFYDRLYKSHQKRIKEFERKWKICFK